MAAVSKTSACVHALSLWGIGRVHGSDPGTKKQFGNHKCSVLSLLLEKSWPNSTVNKSKCSGELVTVFGGTVQGLSIQFSSHNNL